MNANKMPVIILILKNDDGVVFYKAFSPSSYTPPQDDEIDYDADFENFKMRMYSYINYNHNGIDNTTNLGKLLEVHSRHITTPLISVEILCGSQPISTLTLHTSACIDPRPFISHKIVQSHIKICSLHLSILAANTLLYKYIVT